MILGYFLSLSGVWLYRKNVYTLEMNTKVLEVKRFIMFVIYFKKLQHEEIDETNMVQC